MSSSSIYPAYVGSTDGVELDQAFKRIIEALVDKKAQFLFGAGMSQASDIPSGYKLLIKLLELFFPKTGENPPPLKRLKELAREFPFEAIVEAVENSLGKKRDDLTKALKHILIEPKYPISKAHHDFLSICYWKGIPILNQVFTTNFDTLLEKTIGSERAISITEDNSKEIRKAQQNGLIPVIHLHGKLDGEYEITESDVFATNFSTLGSEFKNALFYADVFTFVGYSMTDPDFRRIYIEYRADWNVRKKYEKDSYVVAPPKDEFSYTLGKKIWSARSVKWIPLDAETFFDRLKELMEVHAEIEIREKIKEKYNIVDENALKDLIKQTMGILGIKSYDALQFLLEARTPLGGSK